MSSPRDRRIRVFVSSTFRDMFAERNELMTQTWPELRRFCRERQVEFVEVDLRWGIAEEQSTRRETLKLCLDEIHSCRPFFIGLLGERYGWTPPPDVFTPGLKEEQPWLAALNGSSVTELEILHGVLNNPGAAGRAFFYFRSPEYSKEKGPDFAAENPEATRRQAGLKDAIRRTCAEKGIPLLEDYSDPRALAARVRADLMAAIEQQFPKSEIPDELEREDREQEAFAESHRSAYIKRELAEVTRFTGEVNFNVLFNHALTGSDPLLVVGEPGSGKSALFANWVQRWREINPRDFIFQHYVGATPGSANHLRILARMIGTIKRWTGDNAPLPVSADEISRDFNEWIFKAGRFADDNGAQFIIVIDGLDQLEDRDGASLFGWLPKFQFSGAKRLLLSSSPGPVVESLKPRCWNTQRLALLSQDERVQMIDKYLARFSKKLDAPRLNRIAAAPAAALPRYLKILLDELRVTGSHEKLDALLDDYLSAPNVPALLSKVLARFVRDYERDCPGLVGDALGLIHASRWGLSEGELLRLLRPENLPQLPAATWSPLRAALDDMLADHDGVLCIAYNDFRVEVESAFVPDAAALRRLRLRLADEFSAQPASARTADELPALLHHLEDRGRLRECLLNIGMFLAIRERQGSIGDLSQHWVWLGEERTMGQAYLNAFEQWSKMPGLEPASISSAANELGLFLHESAQENESEILCRRSLEIDESLFGRDTPAVAQKLSNLGELLRNTGRRDQAAPLLQRALDIYERHSGPESRDVAIVLNNLGQLAHDEGDFENAERLMRRVLAIDEECLGKNNATFAVDLNNLGLLMRDIGRDDEAYNLISRALEIDESVLGPEHPDVATRLNNLVLCRTAASIHLDLAPLLLRALAIREKWFGAEHPLVAQSHNNLAHVLLKSDRMDEAEIHSRRAVAIAEKALGPTDPAIATYLGVLAGLLENTNRPGDAIPLVKRMLEINEADLGSDDPAVGVRCAWLAKLMLAAGRPSEAPPWSRRAMQILLADTVRQQQAHPNLNAVVMQHHRVLRQLGMSESAALGELNALGQPYGMRIGG